MLKSVSVGFIPLKRNDEDFKIIEKAELLEVSFVAVPCNANAVSLDQKTFADAVDKGLIIEEKEIKEEITLEKMYEEMLEMKAIVKSLADDKAKETEIELQEEKAKEQKLLLQDVNKATASALEKMKKLNFKF